MWGTCKSRMRSTQEPRLQSPSQLTTGPRAQHRQTVLTHAGGGGANLRSVVAVLEKRKKVRQPKTQDPRLHSFLVPFWAIVLSLMQVSLSCFFQLLGRAHSGHALSRVKISAHSLRAMEIETSQLDWMSSWDQIRICATLINMGKYGFCNESPPVVAQASQRVCIVNHKVTKSLKYTQREV